MESDNQVETENCIRAKLEETGQMGKMRAMIVEAALQSLNPKDTLAQEQELFFRSALLKETIATAQGKESLAMIYRFLEQLGMNYTASVFCMESGISADILHSSPASDSKSLQPTKNTIAAAGKASPKQVYTTTKPDVNTAVKEAKTLPDEPEAKHSSKDITRQEEEVGGEDTTFSISTWKGRTFVRANGQVSGQQVQVEYLTDCTVIVLDPLDSMTVDDCEGGQMIIAACEGSVFLRNCKNMTVHVACKQLRTRDCAHIDLRVFTTTDPVVEMSHHLSFRPFHLRLPDLKKSFFSARLDPKTNRFIHVYDFTPEEKSLPQPHYTVLYPEHGMQMENRYAEYGVPECPPDIEDLLWHKIQPAASLESGANKSYNIKTGAEMWTSTKDASTIVAAAVTTTAMTAGVISNSEAKNNEALKNNSDSYNNGTAQKTMPLAGPTGSSDSAGRPPAAPVMNLSSSNTAIDLDEQNYSSFDESSEEQDDEIEVEEDDDEF